jgi:hypothetical protein
MSPGSGDGEEPNHMDHLQVEELEPRQLLSQTGVPFEPPPEKPPGIVAVWIDEHASLAHSVADFGLADQYLAARADGAAGLLRSTAGIGLAPRDKTDVGQAFRPDAIIGQAFGPDVRPESLTDISFVRQLLAMAVMFWEGRGPEGSARDAPPPGSGDGGPEKWCICLPGFGKDFPGHGLDALGIAANSRANAALPPAVLMQPVANGYATSDTLVMASPSAALNLPLRSLPPGPASGHGLGIEMPSGDAGRPPAVAGKGWDGVFTIGGNGGEASWQQPPAGADPVQTVQGVESSELPLPAVADMAHALLPVDLSALELGLQRFLSQLEQSGRRFVGEFEGADLSPWVVAVAAAATACEIARRQLRTPAEQPGADMNGFSGFPPDAPLAG